MLKDLIVVALSSEAIHESPEPIVAPSKQKNTHHMHSLHTPSDSEDAKKPHKNPRCHNENIEGRLTSRRPEGKEIVAVHYI